MADHSAAGSAMGYIFQSHWALVALLQRGQYEPLCEMRVEKLDDIQFGNSDDPIELLQTKHHSSPASDLSDLSVDVWRTLNVWMDAVDLDAPTLPALTLVTTAVAVESSALNLLRDEGRDIDGAFDRLLAAAQDSENKTTATWRKKFIDLTDDQQRALVSAIELSDGAPRVDKLDEELCTYLRALLPPGHESTFLDRTKGWWARVYLELLGGARSSVCADDAYAVIRQIAQDFGPESLPVSESLRNMLRLEEGLDQKYRGNTFVTQL